MDTEPVSKPQGWPEPDAEGYEQSDVRAQWIGGVVAFLVLGAVAIHFVLGWQLNALGKKKPPRDQWSSVVRPSQQQTRTNFPRLQISAPADLADFRAREEAELNGYGWINKTQAIVRIPIQEAMNLIVDKNLLPVRQGTNAPANGISALQLQQERPVNAEGARK
jgi:hypothetical protein